MIQLRLLGSFELIGPDGVRMDAALRRSKVVAVLAYLAAARPRGPQRRDKVAALFWPELSGERARAALRVTLSRLRDEIGAEVIINSGDEVAVDATRVWCDVVALDECIARGDASGAADLYRGDFLDGVHVEGTDVELEQWISAERSRIRGDIQRALSQASEAAERASDGERALSLARRTVEIAPDDETVSRRLIALLLLTGDRGGALRAYGSLAATLSRDFGVGPSPETQSLVQTIQPQPTPDRVLLPASTAIATHTSASREMLTKSRRRIALPALAAAVVVLLAGAALARGHASAFPDRAAMRWSMVKPVSGPMPRGRLGRGAILDSTGDAILVFGGTQYGDDPATSNISNELWRLRGLRDGETAQWSRVVPTGSAAPEPRSLFGMTYDAAHDRAIVHGGGLGFLSPCANDTWVLDHASGLGAPPSWRRVALRGAPPPGRAGIRLVYESASRRLVVFGGDDCISVFSRDVWVLSFDDSSMTAGRWTQLPVDSSGGVPIGRESYAVAYDAAANRLFVHGGRKANGALGELWMLEHANGLGGQPRWRLLTCGGPAPVRAHQASFFDSSGTLTLFGGEDAAEDYYHDLWRVTGLRGRLDDCRWEQLAWSELAPSARGSAVAMADARSGAVILFGGQFGTTAFSDAWVLSRAGTR